MRSPYIIECSGHEQATALLEPEPDDTDTVWITELYVPERHRRQGVGTALLQQIIEDADFEEVTLMIEVTDPGIAEWLEANDFIETPYHPDARVRYPQ